ncbi:hypothetical protein NK718_13515 [Alsobacter sp. SYSU M60028]|uniref:Type III secretion chaperone SycN n=1 Tax=Alsobacter ponti TaxID=2962936 RepID=A0ABT1LDG7_9HYPH|nr:hypothetical protein [Alsobacter ponti]MCP8939539.1 hypothetical protein [Alsobacter ponti]
MFSSPVAEVIEGFAAQMGLPSVRSGKGGVAFDFESSGRLVLTEEETGRLLICLSWPIGPGDVAERLLRLSGLDETLLIHVHAACDDRGNGMLATRLGEGPMSLPDLVGTVDRLLTMRRSIR